MKKILITGVNGYIGNALKEWMGQFSGEYIFRNLDVRTDLWKDFDFSDYDVIVHLAAIVHVKESSLELYYKVNKELTIEIAKKAKSSGIKQFIFLSTMSVFGKNNGTINKSSETKPINDYGKSKLAAENALKTLISESFSILIIRPPMIYGRNAPGNYTHLSKLVKKIPIFPDCKNRRSMLYIDNLCAFLKLAIDNRLGGTFHPQNIEYVNTTELVKAIGKSNNKKVVIIKGFSTLLNRLGDYFSIFSKVFGTLIYDYDTVGYPGSVINNIKLDYQVVEFQKSISDSEFVKEKGD